MLLYRRGMRYVQALEVGGPVGALWELCVCLGRRMCEVWRRMLVVERLLEGSLWRSHVPGLKGFELAV